MSIRNIVAIVLALTGLIFFFQGLGFTTTIYPSSMDNDIRWSIEGIGQIIIALLIWQRKK
ncbi:MAG TPA: hypothetical protein VLK33_21275 [Terriglobales bacterium]|nr:hypothetical protein [Terriglobales bacterium]